MNQEKISYAKTMYGEAEINAVIKCLNESTQMGNYARNFEAKIAELFDKNECLYVNSGSSALFIGIESFDFPEGGEVITPALTFGTTVGCLIKNNLVPVFVDVEPLTYCIDVNLIEELINKNTVAILAPNLMGNICNWKEIKLIADKYNLVVIEDSADTLGGEINGVKSGYYSDMSITSFYGSHIINCAGNGGALALNDKKIISKAKLLRSWGRSSSLFDEKSEAIENRFNIKLDGIEYDAKFVFESVGYNLEGSEVGAAFGLVQLENLKNNIKIRQKNYKKQYNFFKKFPQFFSNPEETKNVETGWLAYPILIKNDAIFKRRDFQIFLEKRNIQTRVVFTGNILRQPMMKGINHIKSPKGFKNSDAVMERGVLLPVHHGMTEKMFVRLHETIQEFLEKYL
mgnify:CR=1 FL=1